MAMELAFDSKVFSFGGSVERFDSSVSMNVGLEETGGGFAERSTIVSSIGSSSTGVAVAKAQKQKKRNAEGCAE